MNAIADTMGLEELKERHERAKLSLETFELEAALKAVAPDANRVVMEAWGDTIDPREYLYDSPGWGTGLTAVPVTTMADRADGAGLPVFQTEQELAFIRGAGRLLCSGFPAGLNIQDTLANYTIGKGYTYKVAAEIGHEDRAAPVIAKAQRAIDAFLDTNQWPADGEREAHDRAREDGEAFIELVPCGWKTKVKFVEPDQLRDPQGFGRDLENWLGCGEEFESSWSFGVHTRRDEPGLPLGFHVCHDSRGYDYDYVPVARMEQIKRNVYRNTKRGVSDYYPVVQWLVYVEKVLRNTMSGSAVQAAIAFIRQHAATTTASQVSGMVSQNAYSRRSESTPAGSRTRNAMKYEPGTILDTPYGMEHKAGPMGSERAPAFINVIQAGLRYAGVRWQFGEGMISGDYSNNNLASSLTAEHPFTKAREHDQRRFGLYFRGIAWKVLRIAYNAGFFDGTASSWKELESLIDVIVTPSAVATRDPQARATTAQMEIATGTLSKRTAMEEAGRDPEVEFQRIAEEGGVVPATPGQQGGPGQPPAAGEPNPAEFGGLSRLQWQRNRKGIRDVLDELIAGTTSEAAAKVMLGTLGLSDVKADALIADAKDGKIDSALNEAVLESFNADQPRGDDGKWIDSGRIDIAKTDRNEARMLRSEITDPDERAKLDREIGPETNADKKFTEFVSQAVAKNWNNKVIEAKGKADLPPEDLKAAKKIIAERRTLLQAKATAVNKRLRDKHYGGLAKERGNYSAPMNDTEGIVRAKANVMQTLTKHINDSGAKASIQTAKTGTKYIHVETPDGGSFAIRVSDHGKRFAKATDDDGAPLPHVAPDIDVTRNEQEVAAEIKRAIKWISERGAKSQPAMEAWLESWDESKHPRDDQGQFVSGASLKLAMSNPAEAKKLRAKVTDPKQRAILDGIIGAEKGDKVSRKPIEKHAPSKAEVYYKSSRDYAVAMTDKAALEVVGDAYNRRGSNVFASLTGALDDAEVTYEGTFEKTKQHTEVGKDGRVTIHHTPILLVMVEHSHPDYEATRVLGVDDNGKKYIENKTFFISSDAQGKGIGSNIFGRQVEQATEHGFSYIKCHAAKDNPDEPDAPHNGYYTWPRLGYDQPVAKLSKGMQKTIAKNFPNAKSVLDVMSTKEGRDFWKANGEDLFDATFDLTPGSRSLSILEAYRAERLARGLMESEPIPGATSNRSGRVEDIDLTPEQEAALEAAWVKLSKVQAVAESVQDRLSRAADLLWGDYP